MARIYFLISSMLVVVGSVLLISYFNPPKQFDDTEQTNQEANQQEEQNILADETEVDLTETGEEIESEDEPSTSSDATPAANTTFQHTVQMDINGVIEKDAGEEWWVID